VLDDVGAAAAAATSSMAASLTVVDCKNEDVRIIEERWKDDDDTPELCFWMAVHAMAVGTAKERTAAAAAAEILIIRPCYVQI